MHLGICFKEFPHMNVLKMYTCNTEEFPHLHINADSWIFLNNSVHPIFIYFN